MQNIVTKTVSEGDLAKTIADLEEKGYLIAGVDNVDVGGAAMKKVTAKNKDGPVRDGLQFVD